MSFKSVPLDMISAPNFWAPAKNNRWELIDPNAVTLWFRLNIVDSLGERSYVTASGAAMTVIFQRADLIQVDRSIIPQKLTNTAQSVTKTASVHATDKSLFSFTLTAQDVQNIVSGTVKFTLVESGVTTTWVQNYLLQKSLTSPGS